MSHMQDRYVRREMFVEALERAQKAEARVAELEATLQELATMPMGTLADGFRQVASRALGQGRLPPKRDDVPMASVGTAPETPQGMVAEVAGNHSTLSNSSQRLDEAPQRRCEPYRNGGWHSDDCLAQHATSLVGRPESSNCSIPSNSSLSEEYVAELEMERDRERNGRTLAEEQLRRTAEHWRAGEDRIAEIEKSLLECSGSLRSAREQLDKARKQVQRLMNTLAVFADHGHPADWRDRDPDYEVHVIVGLAMDHVIFVRDLLRAHAVYHDVRKELGR